MKKLLSLHIVLVGSIQLAFGQLLINEVMSANATTLYDKKYFNFNDWIEIVNSSDSTVSLDGLFISDKEDNLKKWPLPAINLAAGNYELIYCDKEASGLHTNFGLGSGGETLILSDQNGIIIDSLSFPSLPTDVSFGREGLDSDTKVYFAEPTPGKVNSGGIATLAISDKPDFSIEGGRISAALALELVGENVRYTLDGTEPTPNSSAYDGAINVNKTLTVKARSFAQGKLPSETVANTYFFKEHDFSLPVVSLSFDPDFFYDDEIGIHVRGTNGTEGFCGSVRNWNQNWERAAHFEYFDKAGQKQLSQLAGVKIGGGCTRGRDQKSLSIYARDKYGDGDFDYAIFDEKPHIDRYESVFLRNSGNDQDQTLIRDAAIQAMVVNAIDLDYQAYQPTIVYFNGEYRGIMNLREKVDEDYFDSNYDLQDDEIDFLEGDAIGVRGDTTAYIAMIDLAVSGDMGDDAVYEQVVDQMDLQEFINYWAVQTYIGNRDWPQRNIKYWRMSEDGKWRWVLYDTDYGFGFRLDTPEEETFDRMFDPREDRIWASELFVNLMDNEGFRDQFFATFLANMYSSFHPDWTTQIIDSLAAGIDAEINYNQTKFGRRKSDWTGWVNYFKNQTRQRFTFMEDYFQAYFEIENPVSVKIQHPQPSRGNIIVNEVKLQAKDFDMKTFKEIPLQIEASANSVETPFLRWDFADGSGTYSTDSVISMQESEDVDLIAVFGPEVLLQVSEPENDFVVYPNPATDFVQVSQEFDGGFFELFDLAGRKVQESEVVNAMVSLGNLKAGTYVVKLNKGEKQFRTRLIIR